MQRHTLPVTGERIELIYTGSAQRWIRSLEFLRDELKPCTVVPGHGRVTELDRSLRDSCDYLVFLRGNDRPPLRGGRV